MGVRAGGGPEDGDGAVPFDDVIDRGAQVGNASRTAAISDLRPARSTVAPVALLVRV